MPEQDKESASLFVLLDLSLTPTTISFGMLLVGTGKHGVPVLAGGEHAEGFASRPQLSSLANLGVLQISILSPMWID